MLKNTIPAKIVQDTKDEDANPLAQTANNEPAKTSTTKAAHAGLPTVSKRNPDNVPDNGKSPNKKFKADEQLVDQKVTHYIRNIRYKTMTRRELESLVMRKVIEEEKAKCEIAYIRTQLVKNQKTLAIYLRKIAEMSNPFHELDSMEGQNSHDTAPERTTPVAGQKAAVLEKGQAHAADSMLPSSSGIRSRATSIRAGPKQHDTSEPVKKMQKAANNPTNIVAAGNAKPAKGPIMENDRLGQSENGGHPSESTTKQ